MATQSFGILDPIERADLTAHVHRLIHDISRHEQAVHQVVGLGERAVEPIASYLAGPRESIPHARRFGVRCLGLIGGPKAVNVLRTVLRLHDLAALDPVLAESEYVVKNEAVEQLLLTGRADLAEDFYEAFHRDRLPAAARAVAQFRIVAAIPDLVRASAPAVVRDELRQARTPSGWFVRLRRRWQLFRLRAKTGGLQPSNGSSNAGG